MMVCKEQIVPGLPLTTAQPSLSKLNEALPPYAKNKLIQRRKPSLSINTDFRSSASTIAPNSAPLPSPPTSPSTMNPLQRLSNLASLMVYVIWFDIPLVTLLAEWNIPGNRYFKFRLQCEKVLTGTRLSPPVVVVGLKYLQRIKNERKKSEITVDTLIKTNTQQSFPNESTVWASCLLLAHKYLDDKHFSNPTFASVNCISPKALNKAEMESLRLLDHNLGVSEEEYMIFRKSLQQIVTDSINRIGTNKTTASPLCLTPSSLSPPKESRANQLLFPPRRAWSPFQAPPVSPGILNTPTQMWCPDSPLQPGGPLRLRVRPSSQKTGLTSTVVPSMRSAGVVNHGSPVFAYPLASEKSPYLSGGVSTFQNRRSSLRVNNKSNPIVVVETGRDSAVCINIDGRLQSAGIDGLQHLQIGG